MKTHFKAIAIGTAIFGMVPSAFAAPTIYFGENQNPARE